VQGWTVRWALNILAIITTAYFVPGFELTFWGAIVGSIFLGIVNAIIRPILILLTLPINLVSLGLFTFVINAFTLYLTAATIKGFNIHGFGWAIVTAIVLSFTSFLISLFIKDRVL
jgi:putative membrane protein